MEALLLRSGDRRYGRRAVVVSEANKGRLEVQEILKEVIEKGLAATGHDGWIAMEFANASFQRANSIVLMNRLRSKRVGWQGRKYEPTVDELRRVDEYIDEQHWQLSLVRKRRNDTTQGDDLVEDAADDLIAYFNGYGCDDFRKRNIGMLRIDADSIIVYNDNSDLYQKRAVFTVKIQVPKELKLKVDVVTVEGIEIHKV